MKPSRLDSEKKTIFKNPLLKKQFGAAMYSPQDIFDRKFDYEAWNVFRIEEARKTASLVKFMTPVAMVGKLWEELTKVLFKCPTRFFINEVGEFNLEIYIIDQWPDSPAFNQTISALANFLGDYFRRSEQIPSIYYGYSTTYNCSVTVIRESDPSIIKFK